ncbi:hypothetical protein TELCIR_05710 [Teladorsagia circumcincta]|uniref:C-type lectin domain-containing protein n=1 Tax=Teladorsagia circumcincta TaxID=45464 RepID=A0A2G9UPZ8_TELCI|nr:hypothetical protein TELCIR_05710 [Teladorsagia circumcincta]
MLCYTPMGERDFSIADSVDRVCFFGSMPPPICIFQSTESLKGDWRDGIAWIGLRQANYPQSKEWTWTDGTPVDYTNWKSGQPDNANGKEQCAQV